MARLLTTHTAEHSWYCELNAIAYYIESSFEKILKQYLADVFKEYYVISYKRGIKIDDNEKVPDLALIKKDFREWWIVEVEMKEHDYTHVKDQVTTFIHGEYNAYECADYIETRLLEERLVNPKKKRLLDMIKSCRPQVLVIVDRSEPKWKDELGDLNVKLCVFEIYKNDLSIPAFRIEGEHPQVFTSHSYCRYHKTISNLLEITDKSFFKKKNNKELEIDYNGRITKWNYYQEGKSEYLQYCGPSNPVINDSSYILYKDKLKSYFLKKG